MLWGGVSPTGALHLDPAFVLDAPATPPPPPGPYNLEGIDDDGATLFSLDFEMGQMSEGGGGFVFMLPFREEWLGAADSTAAADSTDAATRAAAADPTTTASPTLARIVLTGPEGSATLDRETRVPMAIVIDRATGRIRAILRGEDAEARIAALSETGAQADAAGDDTRVVFSYGLPRPIPD